MIKETYIQLLTNFTNDNSLINEFWTEIEQYYSDKKRLYHNLSHLQNLLLELLEVKHKIENQNTILFTLFYHDIIYNSLKSDNEEQSAELAEKRMKRINVPATIIENCKSQILATKNHRNNSDSDTNFFTDADLSILGKNETIYQTYSKNVRSEYLFYPTEIYNKGRIEVLEHLLNLNRIYKTEYFYSKYEVRARLNISNEIKNLINQTS